MPSVVRSSAGPSTEAPAEASTDSAPPPYEAPDFPLNPIAQRSLLQLARLHPLQKLDEGLESAAKVLIEAAGDINDRLTNKTSLVNRIQSRGIRVGDDEGSLGSEESLEQLRHKVQSMTQRMDSNLRKLIDGRHSLQSLNKNLQSIMDNARANASTQTSSFNTRSQRRNRANSEETANEGTQGLPEEFTPTDPAGGTQPALPPPYEAFRSRVEEDTTHYQSYPLEARYGESQVYRDFKRVVHDALYPDDSVPLPHYSRWFQEGGAPPPGVRLAANATEDEDEDEDDIAVSRASISTKCPLTLKELEKPLTSKKCPHTFEGKVILGMIAKSSTRVPAPANHKKNTVRVVQCPLPGCDQLLACDDLHEDAMLVRKIKRIQRARQIQEEEDDDDDDDSGGDSNNGYIDDRGHGGPSQRSMSNLRSVTPARRAHDNNPDEERND